MAIFFIAAIGLLLFFLFLQRLSQSNTHLLSDVLQGTSTTLLVISFILFILSGRILYATLLLSTIASFLFFYRSHWRKKSYAPPVQLAQPLTFEEACAILELDASEPFSIETIERAYQKKIDIHTEEQERWKWERAKDFLLTSIQNASSPSSDFL